MFLVSEPAKHVQTPRTGLHCQKVHHVVEPTRRRNSHCTTKPLSERRCGKQKSVAFEVARTLMFKG